MKLTRVLSILAITLLLSAHVAITRAASGSDPWPRNTIDNTSRGADGVRLLDLNQDGLLDLVTGWEEGGLIRLYLNPGKVAARKPWPRVDVGEVGSPEDAVPVDLDADGSVDVASASEGSTRVINLHWAPKDRSRYMQANAWSNSPIPSTRGRQWMFILPMDVDGTNGTDLIVGSKGSNGMIGWLEAPVDARNATDWKLHELRPAGWVMSLIAHDMDGDGDLDVVASDRRGEKSGVFWLENPGAEQSRKGEQWREHAIGAAGREVMFIDLVDLDKDKQMEVVAAVKRTDVLIMRRSASPENTWSTQTITIDPAGIGGAKAVAVADLDLDGKLDMALSFEGAIGEKSGVVWMELPSGRSVAAAEIRTVSGPPGTKFDLLALHDLDDDGDLDIITCEETEQLGVVWYENPAR